MATIEITEISGNELHHKYPRQSQAQGCYVQLDCKTGRLTADWNAEIGNAEPFEAWQGHWQRWGIPALKSTAANSLLAEIAPLAQRVVDGYESAWNGSNHVAEFTADASEAIDEIGTLCERAASDPTDAIAVWDAGDWLGGLGKPMTQCRSIGISASTTDEELAAIEAQLEGEADAEDIVLDGLGEHLEWLRTKAIEDASDDAYLAEARGE